MNTTKVLSVEILQQPESAMKTELIKIPSLIHCDVLVEGERGKEIIQSVKQRMLITFCSYFIFVSLDYFCFLLRYN